MFTPYGSDDAWFATRAHAPLVTWVTIASKEILNKRRCEAFPVLRSGATKTPVYVAQRLNRQTLENVEERRAKRVLCGSPAAPE